MKQLKDYADEINKCSKCGLCQSVCPIYQLTKNDCAVSKGKFVMLEGVIKGDLQLGKTINKYLEMCLKCGKCTDFCPGGIPVIEIFKTAKAEYLANSLEGKLVNFWQSEKVFDKLIGIFARINNSKPLDVPSKSKQTLLYFKGCANNVLPSSEKALKKIFKNLPYTLIENSDLKCCGVPFASSGNIKRYEEVQNFNTELLNNANCDYIITDCASCMDSLKKYPKLTKPVIDFTEFLVKENIHFEFSKELKVTYHKPCHYNNYENIKTLLNNHCKNIKYLEMPNFDDCCGFSGQFALTNRKLSIELSKNKIQNALSVSPDIILTSCPACILGLQQGLIAQKGLFKKAPRIMNVTEFLALSQVSVTD